MKVYYRYTRIDRKNGTVGIVVYELNIHYQSYIIAIYFFSQNLPIKRLTRGRPLDYFKVKRNRLNLCVSKTENRTHMPDRDILIENPDQKSLGHLVKRAKFHHSIKITGEEAEMIIVEFLKTYE